MPAFVLDLRVTHIHLDEEENEVLVTATNETVQLNIVVPREKASTWRIDETLSVTVERDDE